MTPADLRALIENATSIAPWTSEEAEQDTVIVDGLDADTARVADRRDADLICALRHLAPHLAALWEACDYLRFVPDDIKDSPYVLVPTVDVLRLVRVFDALDAAAREQESPDA